MVVGVLGLRGQPVQQHAEGESRVGSVSATALHLSTAAISVTGRPTTVTAVTKKNALLMAVCLTHALVEWIATALQMDPGSVAHALLVSVEMAPTVKTLMSVTWCLMFATK